MKIRVVCIQLWHIISKLCTRVLHSPINERNNYLQLFNYFFDMYCILNFYPYLYLLLCDPFSRAPHLPDWWRWDAEEGDGDPSLTCTFLVSTSAGAAVLGLWECTFRGFLVIVSSCRFRWAQAPIVNYPGLLTLRNL
jgi:hypothetical protein